MQASQQKRTAELIHDAREACRRTRDIVEQLNEVREEVRKTLSFVKWWRFLGYDPELRDFVEKLDLGPKSKSAGAI